jgi:probable biosynthetic protein (TIGR04098 family)
LSAAAAATAAAEEPEAPAHAPRGELPAAPRRIRIGMPHLDAGGLSENWLLRHAGDLVWEAIARRLGVASDELCAPSGERLYPTVLALRARYAQTLAAFVENDVFEASAEVLPCGRATAHGRVGARAGGARLDLELLTAFAFRDGGGAAGADGERAAPLRMAAPAAHLAARWKPLGPAPALARLAKAARRGEPVDDPFSGPLLLAAAATTGEPLGAVVHEPSPYADYNGAGLLYFASYVTLADTAERALVRRLGLSPRPGRDWALAASAVRRDVFFYENLPLGEPLRADLRAFAHGPGPGVTTHVRLRRADSGRAMADLVTRRLLVDRSAERGP